jgi:DNA (cytosine-5)-methyltransferase 1
MKKLRLLDTFSGIGGFSYAAEKLVGGFETTQFVENDPYCQKVLNKHWPNVPIHDDITTFTAKPFQYDVVCGGFPCQSISQAGNREGITETSRSGLWFQLIRTIRMVRPKYFILENVSAILANGLDIVLRDIYEAGYDAEWCCIPSSFVGACHQRDRWWLVAYPNSKQSSGTESEIQTRRIFSSSSNRSGNVADSNSYGLQREIGSRLHRPTWRTQNIRRLNQNWRQYESKPCLRRGDDGLSNRVDRLKALGNAVVPQVAAIPLQRVKTLHESLTTVDH